MTNPPFVKASNLDKSNIKHGFFGSKGGVSSGIYSTLNCGFGSDDSYENVAKNRKLVANSISENQNKIQTTYQYHSNQCVIIDDFVDKTTKADAIVTNSKNLILGILTADCAPILFADFEKQIIGAAHAGWKGALSGIIEVTIQAMKTLGAENISAAIGPCIAQDSYEVGAEFRDNFLLEDEANNRFFVGSPIAIGKYHFDLKAYCAYRLKAAGIFNLETLSFDTCALKDDYFSNRRRNLMHQSDYGRNISVIMIE